MIYLAEVSSPLGPLTIAECKQRVLAVAFCRREEMPRVRPTLWKLGQVESAGSVTPCADRIQAYLGGAGDRLRLAVDLSLVRGQFERIVLKTLFKTRPGELLSYGELAERAGRPRAARAVGSVMARNPLPIVVPCHRVVPRAGGVGQYTGGAEKKTWLLAREQACLGEDQLPSQKRSARPSGVTTA